MKKSEIIRCLFLFMNEEGISKEEIVEFLSYVKFKNFGEIKKHEVNQALAKAIALLVEDEAICGSSGT